MMNTDSDEASPPQEFIRLYIILGAMIFSVFLYGGILFLLLSVYKDATTELASTPALPIEISAALTVAALTIASSIPFIRSWLLPKEETSLTARSVAPSTSIKVPERYFTVQIVTFALCESIAIFGFALTFLTKTVWVYFPFALVAIGLLIFYAPRRSHFEPTTL